MRTKTFKLLMFALLLCSMAEGQAAYTKAIESFTVSTSGNTFTHPNAIGELNWTAEYVLSGSPTITSIIVQGCMRGGTCDSLSTYSASVNGQVHGGGSTYDSYTVTPTWSACGSPPCTVKINWNGSANSSPSGGSVSLSGGTVVATQANGANLHVNVDNNQTTVTGALTNASSASCTGAGVGANGVTIATSGASSVSVNVTGTNTSAIGFYYSMDGTNYQAVPAGGLIQVLPAAGGTAVTTFSANGQWVAQVGSAADFMVCGAAGAAQTATITLQASLAPNAVTATLNGVTIKGAAIFPTNADPAVVVSINPIGTNPCWNFGNSTGGLQTVTGTTSGTAATQIIALSGAQKIYLCNVVVISSSGTTPTFSLVYGTGSNCATGQTVLLPAIATAGSGTLFTFGGTPQFVVPASNALCYLDAGTTPVQTFSITYAIHT